MQEALSAPLEPLQDTAVPDTLLPPAQLREKARLTPQAFVPLQAQKVGLSGGGALESAMNSMFGGGRGGAAGAAGAAGGADGRADGRVGSLGVLQRQLRNGIKVNLKSLDAEPQRVSMRLYVPGEPSICEFFCCLLCWIQIDSQQKCINNHGLRPVTTFPC